MFIILLANFILERDLLEKLKGFQCFGIFRYPYAVKQLLMLICNRNLSQLTDFY